MRILEQHPDELDRFRARFHYLLVDEYQDTNRAQYRLVQLLGGGHGNVCVVGDDDQSIYGWRGADIRNILDFEKDFPDAHVVRLEENYRSTPPILALANVVISANTDRMGKTLRATRSGGERVTVVRAARRARRGRLAGRGDCAVSARPTGWQLRDFAVLYRTNAQSRALEEALRRHAMPYRLVGAVRFYDRREIRDLMGYLKLIANPADDEAFRRAIAVPRRGVGDTTVDLLAERARAAGIPLFEAATRDDCLDGVRPAARTALADFCALIARFRDRARESAVDELLSALVDEIRYGEYLRAEGEEMARDRLDNVRELIAGASETVADVEGEVGLSPLDHLPPARQPRGRRRQAGRRRRRRDADDAAQRQGARVSRGVHHRPRGRSLSARPGLRRSETARGGAAPVLRRDHARRASPVPAARRVAPPQRRVPPVAAVELPRRDARRHARPAGHHPRTEQRARCDGGIRRTRRHPSQWWMGGGSSQIFDDDIFPSSSAAARRPGRPIGGVAVEDESQDAATIAVGARVKHRKFGSGTIAELTGAGAQTKVRVDFDDDAIGRKTLVVAQANLERGID